MWPLLAYLATFACWGGFVWWLWRFSDDEAKKLLPAAYAGAGIIALFLLVLPPIFSTDLYRYLWDGGLLLHDTNPYTLTPQDVSLPALRDALYQKLNWTDQYTVYPPLAQVLFAVAYLLFSAFGLAAAKALFASAVVGAWWVLYRLVPTRIFIAALLNPLLLFEAFNGGHLDVFVIALLLGAYYLLTHERYLGSSLLLAGAVLIKLYPVVFVPLFVAEVWRRWGSCAALKHAALCIGVVGAFFAPLMPHLPFLIERYGSWVQEMVFNASLFAITGSSLISFVVLGAGVLYLSTQRLSPATLLCAALLFIVTSSVVYPWYTLVALPFLFLFIGDGKERYWLLYACALVQMLFSLTYVNIYLLYTTPFELRMATLHAIAMAEYGVLLLFIAYVVRKNLAAP